MRVVIYVTSRGVHDQLRQRNLDITFEIQIGVIDEPFVYPTLNMLGMVAGYIILSFNRGRPGIISMFQIIDICDRWLIVCPDGSFFVVLEPSYSPVSNRKIVVFPGRPLVIDA